MWEETESWSWYRLDLCCGPRSWNETRFWQLVHLLLNLLADTVTQTCLKLTNTSRVHWLSASSDAAQWELRLFDLWDSPTC